MITLAVLGSGSKGNAFVLGCGGGALLIEAGFGARTILRRMADQGLDAAAIQGIVLTHEHGDHAQGGPALAQRLGVPLLCSGGTWRALGRPEGVAHVRLRPSRTMEFGPFTIDACITTHDADEPLAIAVTTRELRVGVATDIGRPTAAVRYLLRQSNALVIESNYDEVQLRMGRYPSSVQHRIAGSRGHLSNRAAADLVTELLHDGLRAVVLAHLSQQCNDPATARRTVEPLLRSRGFLGELWVAEQDRSLPTICIRPAPGPAQGELALRWTAPEPAPTPQAGGRAARQSLGGT